MGNGVKILLVALLILSVVVVAKFVQDDSTPDSTENPPAPVAEKPSQNRPATRRSAANPSSRTNRAASPNSAIRRPGTGRIVGSTPSNSTASPSSGRVRPATEPKERKPSSSTNRAIRPPRSAGTGRVLTLPMKTRADKTKLAEPSRAETGGTEKSAGNRVSVKVTPPPTGRATRGSEEIGSPGFDPVPSPQAGEGAGSLVSLDPKAPTKPGTPFRATQSELRDFSGVNRSDSKKIDPARAAPKLVDAPITSSGSGASPSPFNRSVSQGSGRTPTSEPSTSTSAAFPRTHTVVKGDTYWDIAELYYGSGLQCKTIQKANGSKPLVPGMKVKVPAPPRPVARATSAAPDTGSADKGAVATSSASRTGTASTRSEGTTSQVKSPDGRYYIHTVRAGETLSDLAKRYYGSPRSFDVIEEANPRVLYESLRVNQKIRIPVR